MNLHLQVFLLFQVLFRLRRPPLLRLRLLIELLRLVPWPGLVDPAPGFKPDTRIDTAARLTGCPGRAGAGSYSRPIRAGPSTWRRISVICA